MEADPDLVDCIKERVPEVVGYHYSSMPSRTSVHHVEDVSTIINHEVTFNLVVEFVSSVDIWLLSLVLASSTHDIRDRFDIIWE